MWLAASSDETVSVAMVRSGSGRAAKLKAPVSRRCRYCSTEVSLQNAERLLDAMRASITASLQVSAMKRIRAPPFSMTLLAALMNEGGTDASGLKVKMNDRSARTASLNADSQISSRNLTKPGDPNSNSDSAASTAMWL